jgi:hypothetical protein
MPVYDSSLCGSCGKQTSTARKKAALRAVDPPNLSVWQPEPRIQQAGVIERDISLPLSHVKGRRQIGPGRRPIEPHEKLCHAIDVCDTDAPGGDRVIQQMGVIKAPHHDKPIDDDPFAVDG